MGIDHGEARIGVALSDELGLFAQPYTIIPHRTYKADLSALQAIIAEHHIVKVVVGLPTDSDGHIGSQAKAVLRWAKKLAQSIGCPVALWDESYSSAEAAAMMADRAFKRRKRKGQPAHLDDLAAAIMLQEYLDAGGAVDEPGQPLENLTDNR